MGVKSTCSPQNTSKYLFFDPKVQKHLFVCEGCPKKWKKWETNKEAKARPGGALFDTLNCFFFVVLPLPLHCGQRPDGQKKLIFRKAPLNRCLHISSLGKIPYDLFLILMSFLMDLINHWQHYCNWKLAFLELDWKKFSLVIC